MAKFVRHHVRRVLGPAEAGLDEREAGLHEDDEHRADDDPEQVHLDAQSRRCILALGLGTGRCRSDERQDHDQCGHEGPPRSFPEPFHAPPPAPRSAS